VSGRQSFIFIFHLAGRNPGKVRPASWKMKEDKDGIGRQAIDGSILLSRVLSCPSIGGLTREQRPADRRTGQDNRNLDLFFSCSAVGISFGQRQNKKRERHRNPSVYSLLVSPPADWFFLLRRLVVRLRD
jgi:hypothetical protein